MNIDDLPPFNPKKLPPFNPDLAMDENDNTNGVRADRADKAVKVYAEGLYKDGDSLDDAMQDLVADVMHLAHRTGIDPFVMVRLASSGFYEESGGNR